MTNTNDDELEYVHARIDQLIQQIALEVGLQDRERRNLPRNQWSDSVKMASNRFWGADDVAAEFFHRPKRQRP